MHEHSVTTDYVVMTTIPSTPSTSPSSTTGTSPYQKPVNRDHTHVLCCKNDNSSEPVVEKLPLPDLQPTCPKQWNDYAWRYHTVGGNSRYHIFVPGKNDKPPFVLKVSDKIRDRRWIYEDISPTSPKQLKDEMGKFKAQIFDSLEKVRKIEEPKVIAAYPDDAEKSEERVIDGARDFNDTLTLKGIQSAVAPPGVYVS